MKKLVVSIGFAAMLSLFTAIGASAEGFGNRSNSHQPARAQNERGMANRGQMDRQGDHGRFDRRDDKSRMDRDRSGDRFDRGRGGDHFRDRHYDEHQYRDWR